MNRTIKLTISYDGTNFSGWQKQKNERSVQEEIEKALSEIHRHKVTITGSGRTDAGVHAKGQCASFITDIAKIPAQNFVPALNSLLPSDVRILKSEHVFNAFNARFHARSRTYRYFIKMGTTADAFDVRYSWYIRRNPNIEILNRMASYLLGEHDFTTFSNPKDKSSSRFRYIYRSHFFLEDNNLIFEIEANAFLWNMVRSLTGTILGCEANKEDPIAFKKILSSCKRENVGITAPAHALYLWNITYYNSFSIPKNL